MRRKSTNERREQAVRCSERLVPFGRGRTLRSAGGVLLTGAMLAFSPGCSEDSSTARAPSTASEPHDYSEAGARDTSDAGSLVCNTLTADKLPEATLEAVTEQAPVPTGGTITEGTYVATRSILYASLEPVAPTPAGRSKVVIAKGTWQTISADPAASGTTTTTATTETVVAEGSTLKLSATCPSVSEKVAQFSVTPSNGGSPPGFVLYYGAGTEAVTAVVYEQATGP